MRKNSKQAQHITQLIHQVMQAIESNDEQSRIRAFSDAWCIDRANRERGGTGYSLKWFFDIADQYPAALAADPRLVEVKANWETERRAFIRGKGDYTRGYIGNPYCAYTNEIAYEAWDEGWQAAVAEDEDEDEDEDDHCRRQSEIDTMSTGQGKGDVMTQGHIGVNARGLIEALNDVANEAYKLGADKVAKRAGVKPAIVKKFIADVMQSKNSDVRKIRNAVTEMLAEKTAPTGEASK